ARELVLRGWLALHHVAGREQLLFVLRGERPARGVQRDDLMSFLAQRLGDSETARERHVALGGGSAHQNRYSHVDVILSSLSECMSFRVREANEESRKLVHRD